jgi:uncharacterized protein (DUF1778 family)
MSKTSSAVKNKYNEKAYDRIALVVKKGEKEIISAHASRMGESTNGFITRAIFELIEKEKNAD